MLLAQRSIAAEKPLACMTLGTSNNGKVIGVRLFNSGDGKLIATVDEVTMFHYVVVSFDLQPLRTINLETIFSHFGDKYRGDGFALDTFDFGFPSNPHEAVGQLRLDLNGSQINKNVEIAEDYNSGYCE